MSKLALPEDSYQEAGPDEASLRGGAHNQRTLPEQVAVTKNATQPISTSHHPDQDLVRTSSCLTFLSQFRDNSVAKYHHHVPETSQKALSTAPQLPLLAKQHGIAQEQGLQSMLPQARHAGNLPIYPVGSGLGGTSTQVNPVDKNLPFQAPGGESLLFWGQMGQWHNQVLSGIGVAPWLAMIPVVVCGLGRNVAGKLRVLQKCPNGYRKLRIHGLSGQQVAYLREFVYGRGSGWESGEGHSSNSGEPIKQAANQFLSNCKAIGRTANATGFPYPGKAYFADKEKASYDIGQAYPVSFPQTPTRSLALGRQVLGILLLSAQAANQQEEEQQYT